MGRADMPYGLSAVRRGAWDFLTGRAASAVLNIACMALLVRAMSLSEYSVYVAWQALLELFLGFSSLGLVWVATRYLPEFRLKASAVQLKAFIVRWIACVGLGLALAVLLARLLLDTYLNWVSLQALRDTALLFLLVMAVEVAGRQLREAILEPLMQQRASRTALVVRQGLLFVGLFVLGLSGGLSLRQVVLMELVAACVAALIAAVALLRHLGADGRVSADPDWRPPTVAEMFRTAWHMFAAQLITLSYGAAALTLLAQRFLGQEATAVFGLLRQLTEMLSRYMPSTLLLSVVRPKLVADYCNRGLSALERSGGLVAKVSVLSASGMIGFICLFGNDLVARLSGGKFTDAGLMFAALTLSLLPMALRQLYETVALATGRSGLCLWASCSGVLTLPVMAGLAAVGAGLPAVVVGYVAGHWVVVVALAWLLKGQAGFRLAVAGQLKGVLCVVLGVLAASLVRTSWPQAVEMTVQLLTFLVGSWVAALWLRPVNAEECSALDQFVGRRVFARVFRPA